MEVGGRNPHLDGLIEMSPWQPAAWIHGRSEVSTTGRNEKNKKHSFLTEHCCCFFPTRRDAAVVRSSTEECLKGMGRRDWGSVTMATAGGRVQLASHAMQVIQDDGAVRSAVFSGPLPPPRVSHLSPSHDGPPASLSGSEQICAVRDLFISLYSIFNFIGR